MSLLTLQDFCSALSISLATGRNWLKQQKIVPTTWQEGQPFFSEAYVVSYQRQLQNGSKNALKSRRNKSYISGTDLYKSYITNTSSNASKVALLCEQLSDLELSNHPLADHADQVMYLLLADCALQLLSQAILGKKKKYPAGCIFSSISDDSIQVVFPLLAPLFASVTELEALKTAYPALWETTYDYYPKEDTLGYLYMSLKSLTARKATGAYYTPTVIVKQLINSLCISKNALVHATFLDPCCGTGNFLLQLPVKVSISQMYGFDIDAISICLTRINMALRTKGQDIDMIQSHFLVKDYLLDSLSQALPRQYDVILGNPPWGFSFTEEMHKTLRPLYECAKSKRLESYDLFVERSFSLLPSHGVLSFVLPEAILQVKNHHRIRTFLLNHSKLRSVQYLGNIFHKVLCPCIILQLSPSAEGFCCRGAEISFQGQAYTIRKERNFTAAGFFLTCDDQQYALIKKMTSQANMETLKDQADFALGIVTGNNSNFLAENAKKDFEPIMRGTDIHKYHIDESTNFIRFQPDILQQSADELLYRAPKKLCYRFISEQLVFACDTKQRVSLNSCNALIPHIDGLHIQYIQAILNARCSQFIYHTYFHSVKVLRSHLEELPIPVVSSEKQSEIIQYVDQLEHCGSLEEKEKLYNRLDFCIAKLYKLTDKEYEIICNSLSNCSLFL